MKSHQACPYQEVLEERGKLEASRSKGPNERLQRADEEVDLVCRELKCYFPLVFS